MTDWRIWIAILIVSVLAWAPLETSFRKFLRRRSLVRLGRTIASTDALLSFENGSGAIVRNRSTLPGRWWFYKLADKKSEFDLWMTLRDHGYLVLTGSRKDIQTLHSLEGKIEEMIEPFED